MIQHRTPATAGGADILALGFGTSVAMWALGYLLRLPALAVPSQLLLTLMLLALLGGGYAAGRLGPRGWRGGLLAGLLAAALNMLVLGSLLGGQQPGQVVPSALWWLPGSLLAGALLGAAGGILGARRAAAARGPRPQPAPGASRDWTSIFASVAAAATFFLLIVGGVVTGQEAGLAVLDWPNSFGYNMFLYPLSRMTGGVYYEHAHRLFGALVGLTTLALALHLQRADPRPPVRRFALFALALVIAQGVLGGLRVTGRLTLSASPLETSPSLALAVVHGVLGQLFFCALIALAVVTSSAWRSGPPPVELRGVDTDRALARLLAGLLVVQLVLGALQRHLNDGLLVHITFAVFVSLAALGVGLRTWGRYGGQGGQPGHAGSGLLSALGRWLLILIALQLLLGVGALVASGGRSALPAPAAADVIITTTHQAVGAVLLALSVALALWLQRLAAPAAQASGAPAVSSGGAPSGA